MASARGKQARASKKAASKQKASTKATTRKPAPRREAPGALKKRALRISRMIRKVYSGQGTALKFEDPFQLLVATILSAQCTDDQVNRVTPALFEACPTARAMAAAETEAVEKLIYKTGFYRQKTKSIQAMSRSLIDNFGGRVPESMEELTQLAGVGRKTANLVRAEAFGNPGLIVDTHFKRVTGRLGLHDLANPDKIEFALAELLPPSHWTEFSNAMIWHGRRYCPAQKPRCPDCPVLKECPFGREEIAKGRGV